MAKDNWLKCGKGSKSQGLNSDKWEWLKENGRIQKINVLFCIKGIKPDNLEFIDVTVKVIHCLKNIFKKGGDFKKVKTENNFKLGHFKIDIAKVSMQAWI